MCFRGPFNQGSRCDVRSLEKDPKVSAGGGYDRRGIGALLPSDPSRFQHVQEQKMYMRFYSVNIGDKIDYGQRKNENLSDLIQETL